MFCLSQALTTIIIPSIKKTEKYTDLCIQSIEMHTLQEETPFEIIVENDKPFCKSINNGVKKAKGEFLVILNNDAMVMKDWLVNFHRLYNILSKKQNVGLVGTYFTGLPGNLQDLTSNQFIEKTLRLSPRIVMVCVFISKKTFFDVGGMDESFPHGNFADDDLCIKCLEKGYTNWIAPFVTLHFGHSSFDNENWKKDMGEGQNRMKLKFGENWRNIYIKYESLQK